MSFTNNDFQLWMFHMDDRLEQFSQSLPSALAAKLNYSPGSLVHLEEWILQRYAASEEIIHQKEAKTADGLARYVGETFRKQLGGYWNIELENIRNAYYGVPVITGFEEKPTPVCPLMMVSASTDRRTGVFLQSILENCITRLPNL